MKQLHSKIPKLKTSCYHQSQLKKINLKYNLKHINHTFHSEKFETKAIKISVLCFWEVEKFNLLLECLLPYTHPIIYPKCIGSGIQNTGKPNKLLSVMTVCRHGFHNGVMAYMLQFG